MQITIERKLRPSAKARQCSKSGSTGTTKMGANTRQPEKVAETQTKSVIDLIKRSYHLSLVSLRKENILKIYLQKVMDQHNISKSYKWALA